jgi:isoquinoline 1-oxidoreductase alpha subunit
MCGYCEPGFIMAIAAMLQSTPSPSEEAIAALPNLCRCGAYPRIRKAIARAAQVSAPLGAPNPERTDPKRLSLGSSQKEHDSL